MALAAFKSEFRVLVTLYVICLVIGQMVKPKLGDVSITMVDLLIASVLPIISIRLRAPPVVYVALAMFLLPNILFGLAYQLEGKIESKQLFMGLYACYRFLLPLMLIFCFGKRITTADRVFCLRLLIWGVGFHIFFGMFQAATLPSFALEYGPQDIAWDYQENRLVSTFLDPNLVSGLFYCAALALLCHLSSPGVKLEPRFLLVISGAALGAALTASRGGALAFTLTFGLLLLETRDLSVRTKIKWISLTVLAIAAAALVFILFFGMDFIVRTDRFGASNASVTTRLTNIAALAIVFLENPVFGRGFNFLPYLSGMDFIAATGNYVDGGLLYLLASAGIFGSLSLALTAYLAARTFRRPRLLIYPLIFLVVHSVSTSSMFYPLSTMFVVLMALSLDMQQGYSPTRNSTRTPIPHPQTPTVV